MDSPASHRISVPGGTQDPARSFCAFMYRTITFFGRLSHTFPLAHTVPSCGPTTPHCCGLGFSHFARHYFGNNLFSFWYLDVSVPRVPSRTLCIHARVTGVLPAGFPHSDIFESSLVHSSSKLFAVSHVLLRHLTPRHPP